MDELSDDDVEFLKDILREDTEDELDALLEHTEQSTSTFAAKACDSDRSVFNSPKPKARNGPLEKCIQICLGGTEMPVGRMSDVNDPHFCGNLFCISCDHNVIRFTDRKWNEKTDYLFLRNNYPDKVQKNLIYAPNWCAYCCQCTFKDTDQVEKLRPYSTSWVCRGH